MEDTLELRAELIQIAHKPNRDWNDKDYTTANRYIIENTSYVMLPRSESYFNFRKTHSHMYTGTHNYKIDYRKLLGRGFGGTETIIRLVTNTKAKRK